MASTVVPFFDIDFFNVFEEVLRGRGNLLHADPSNPDQPETPEYLSKPYSPVKPPVLSLAIPGGAAANNPDKKLGQYIVEDKLKKEKLIEDLPDPKTLDKKQFAPDLTGVMDGTFQHAISSLSGLSAKESPSKDDSKAEDPKDPESGTLQEKYLSLNKSMSNSEVSIL